MRELVIKEGVLTSVAEHAVSTYPEESCGFLFGYEGGNAVSVVTTMPVENRRPDQRAKRYQIGPVQYLKGEQFANESGCDFIGIYHSHPDHSAVPSHYDLEWAVPGFIYLIVNVLHGSVRDARWWKLSPDRSKFVEVKRIRKTLEEDSS